MVGGSVLLEWVVDDWRGQRTSGLQRPEDGRCQMVGSDSDTHQKHEFMISGSQTGTLN